MANLLQPYEDGYGAITFLESEEERRQRKLRQCSRRWSVCMSLLACTILAIGLFVWYQMVSDQYGGHMGSIDDDKPFGRGNLHTHLMEHDDVDYTKISNSDWRALWVDMGYEEETVNTIDFHTYSVLGVDYQKMYRHLNDEDSETDDIGSFEDCSCDYCLGLCGDEYCPICMQPSEEEKDEMH